LVEANAASPLSWVVCAPGPVPSGGHATVSYGGAIRRGVAISVSPAGTNGCATFRLSVGRTYRPFVPVRHDCTRSWRILNAEAALAANDPKLNIEQLIESKLPAQYRPAVARDPTYDCYDALQDHDPNGAGYSAGKSGIVTNDDQPFPFVGWARVTWAASN
ncbi:MAG TPA: hypothetical protein DIT48_07080, partial [Actinobacteria bacterium]|nr:hypothetical protein [Actinomycetota bacterium]